MKILLYLLILDPNEVNSINFFKANFNYNNIFDKINVNCFI